MGIARSTFYDAPPVKVGDAETVARIRAICDGFETYSYRRVTAALHRSFSLGGDRT
jgi:putative transposase